MYQNIGALLLVTEGFILCAFETIAVHNKTMPNILSYFVRNTECSILTFVSTKRGACSHHRVDTDYLF